MKNFDVIVVGGGLAGLSAAAHLIERDSNLNILVYDARNIGEGASGVPAGMINPVTGQNARIAWRTESSMQLIEKRLDILSQRSETRLSLDTGVLRPAFDEKLRESFQSALGNKRSKPNWLEWYTAETITQKLPFLKETEGGLFLRKGKVVRTPEYLDAFVKYLRDQGVHFKFGGNYQLRQNESAWNMESRSDTISADRVIVTTGYKSRENQYWTELPVNTVKGQLAIYHCDERVDSHPAVSAYGYIAPLDAHQLAVGSTYEHHYHDEKPDGRGAGQLDQKLKEMMPGLYPKCQRIGQWSGVRATTPDRMPIVGEHPGHKGLFIYTGLGSKGLLYSEQAGDLLSRHLLQNEDLPEDISLYRFAQYRDLRKKFSEQV